MIFAILPIHENHRNCVTNQKLSLLLRSTTGFYLIFEGHDAEVFDEGDLKNVLTGFSSISQVFLVVAQEYLCPYFLV